MEVSLCAVEASPKKCNWKTWRCPGSCQGYWSSQASLKRHVQDIHSDIISTGGLNASIARNERMKPLDAKTECPLCRETLDSIKEYRQHVGKHLVDLALFALPKTGDREDSDDYDEMGDDKVVDSSEVDDDNNVDDNDEVTVDNGLDQADGLDDQAELCTTERRGRHGMLQSDDSKSIPSKKANAKGILPLPDQSKQGLAMRAYHRLLQHSRSDNNTQ